MHTAEKLKRLIDLGMEIKIGGLVWGDGDREYWCEIDGLRTAGEYRHDATLPDAVDALWDSPTAQLYRGVIGEAEFCRIKRQTLRSNLMVVAASATDAVTAVASHLRKVGGRKTG